MRINTVTIENDTAATSTHDNEGWQSPKHIRKIRKETGEDGNNIFNNNSYQPLAELEDSNEMEQEVIDDTTQSNTENNDNDENYHSGA